MRDDVAGLGYIEISHLHLHELCENILAHLFDDAAGKIDHDDLQRILHQTGHGIRYEHENAECDDLIEIRLSFADADCINCGAGELRTDEREKICENGENERCEITPLEMGHVFAQSQEDLQFFL